MKKLQNLNKKKGVAGLNILLSIISMLFMIGIVVMVFILASSKLSDTLSEESTANIFNQSLTLINGTAVDSSVASLRSVDLSSIIVTNTTGGFPILAVGNWSQSGGSFTALTTNINSLEVNVSFAYTYLMDTTASAQIVDTGEAIGDASDWFSTFIVLASLVVLILLVVIIINSIRSSGITTGA